MKEEPDLRKVTNLIDLYKMGVEQTLSIFPFKFTTTNFISFVTYDIYMWCSPPGQAARRQIFDMVCTKVTLYSKN